MIGSMVIIVEAAMTHIRPRGRIIEDRIDLDGHGELIMIIQENQSIEELVPSDHESVNTHRDQGRDG